MPSPGARIACRPIGHSSTTARRPVIELPDASTRLGVRRTLRPRAVLHDRVGGVPWNDRDHRGARSSGGLLGAAAAAWFAIWMLFFPQYVPGVLRLGRPTAVRQAFIGAGYIFRTLFFLNVARESNWIRLRWIVWGNLAFTGTLLLATYWHIDEFNWPSSRRRPPTSGSSCTSSSRS